MVSTLVVIVLLCGLWSAAHAKTDPDDCLKCPSGWTRIDKRCYMFFNMEKDWADAEHICTSLGANLASLRNAAIHESIREMIYRVTGTHKKTWVGGYDAVKEGVWLWSDGFHFDFNRWDTGQPNNMAGQEHCMEINFKENYVQDVNCKVKNPFVCARDP